MNPSDPQKSLAISKIRSIFAPILVPTWLHFGRILTILGASGRLLERLGGILAASWGVLRRLRAILDLLGRLEPSWRRLGLPNHPNINLTRHGTGSAVYFSACLQLALRKPLGTVLDRKASPRTPERSARFGRCARLTVVSYV